MVYTAPSSAFPIWSAWRQGYWVAMVEKWGFMFCGNHLFTLIWVAPPPQHPTFIVTGWLVMLVTIGVLTSWDEWPVWRDRLYVRIEWGAGANTPTSLIFCKMSTSAVSIKNFQCHSRTSLCWKWLEKQIRRERNLSDSWQVSEECSKQFLSVTSLQPLVLSRAVTRVWQICVVLKFY